MWPTLINSDKYQKAEVFPWIPLRSSQSTSPFSGLCNDGAYIVKKEA